MACFGCQHKQILSELDVEALVEEQLLLEPNQVSILVRNQRLVVCGTCSQLLQHTCSKCGCFIKFRASLAGKECPLKKW